MTTTIEPRPALELAPYRSLEDDQLSDRIEAVRRITEEIDGLESILAEKDGDPEMRELAGVEIKDALEADIAERIASKAWALGRKGAFEATAELMSLAGCGAGSMAAILKGLGYRGRKDKGGVTRFRRASKPKPKKQETGRAVGSTGKQQEARKPRRKRVIQDSPFAKLGDLTAAPGK